MDAQVGSQFSKGVDVTNIIPQKRSRIEKTAAKRQEDAQRVREATQANYDDKKVFKFHQTKGGQSRRCVR